MNNKLTMANNKQFVGMKKIILIFLAVIVVAGCKKDDSNPLTPNIVKLGGIEGFITESSTGKAVSQVYITTENSTHAVTSDIDGYYSIMNIASGEYTLKASKVGYQDASVKIRVDSGYTTRADLILEKIKANGRIGGRVINSADGIGIPAAIITTDPYIGSVSTDALGIYNLANVSPGVQYTITASKTGFESKQFIITAIADTTLKLDIVLDPIYGTIEGKVTDADTGNPLSLVNITTTPATSSVFTDSNGNYTLTNVPKTANSEYEITAVKSGYTDAKVTVTLLPGKTVTANILMYKK